MEAQAETWTVLRLLQWAARDFASKGMSDARLSAEVLLSHVLKTNRVGLYLKFDLPTDDSQREQFKELVQRRRRGEPVAYLVEEKEFYSLRFHVDPRVLIPRPETELLVDEARESLKRMGIPSPRICDVGTGSGVLAITLKRYFPEANITAVDVRADALEVARENAGRLETEIHFMESDLLTGCEGPFDLVVANLPYIPDSDLPFLPTDVRDFEPHSALGGGSNGLALIRKLVTQARDFLRPGVLLLEIGINQDEAVTEFLRQEGYTVETVRKDFAGIPRVVGSTFGGTNGSR